ncbi:twinkle homolog protein, chloroplastic/mitochondrial-like [Wolffia australiana]
MPATGNTVRNFIQSGILMNTSNNLSWRRAVFYRPLLHRCPLPSRRSISISDVGIAPSAMRLCLVRAYTPSSLSRTAVPEAAEEDSLEVLRRLLEEKGIPCRAGKPGQYTHMICPKCGGGKTKEGSFSLFIREDGKLAMWSCFRGKCGWRGHLQASGDMKEYNAPAAPNGKPLKEYRQLWEEDLELQPLCNEIVTWFSERMISTETLRRNDVMQRKYGNEIVIAFTYKRDGKLVSCKYRGNNKRFFQEKNTERVFYGLDDIKTASEIIIVEGEIDKLSLEEAGFPNCISVPDGAPSKVSPDIPQENEDTQFQYLWNCKEYLEKASRIILATDSDQPGQALAEELSRRLGKERCWRVTWPKKNGFETFKDANEVLMCLGPDAVRKAIEEAELYPIKGLFSFRNYFHEIDSYYNLRHGDELGVSTGWSGVDEFYRVVPGELTVVTGVPNSGKSEWIDALLCNLNEATGWTFALCSMENKVREHARKLLEKRIKKPFFNAPYGNTIERMTAEDLEQGKEWLDNTFHLIRCEDDCLPSVNWVLNLAKAAVLRHGIRGLVIDPYNELDHQRQPNQTETEYVSLMLTKIKRFAQHHSCHVWFVAHPRQLQSWNGSAPNLYDISGSAHFINKCDNGIVIHRIRDESEGPPNSIKVHVRKVRNKVAGRIGDASLTYDCATGVYRDCPPQV